MKPYRVLQILDKYYVVRPDNTIVNGIKFNSKTGANTYRQRLIDFGYCTDGGFEHVTKPADIEAFKRQSNCSR